MTLDDLTPVVGAAPIVETPSDPSHDPQRAIRLDPIAKARRNPTSLRLAINAKCYDCGGQDADPGWHGRIRDCAVPSCPLYPVRPYQRGDDDLEGRAAR